MAIDDKKLIDILVEEKYVSRGDLEIAEKESQKKGIHVIDYLLGNNFLSIDLLGQAIAEYYKVDYADLNTIEPSQNQVFKIPEKIARKFYVVVFKEDEKEIVIATDEPNNPEAKTTLSVFFPGKNIKFAYSLRSDIEKIFAFYKEELSSRFSNIIKEEKKIAPELVLQILEDALDYNASDVHFEPSKSETKIRFRVDGSLQEVGKISNEYYKNIVNYLKVLASLRIDKHRSTQDGAIRFENKGSNIDIRISLAPVIYGEKVVLRILSKHLSELSIDNLGFSKKDQQDFESYSQKPYGMIVVSGPTGSGKTTTLYSLLKKINGKNINITTIEDPVEFIIDGANQIQVNNDSGITFSKGLRSIVRQDPDVILVGEIRDKETAEISINAALTGHLLFSTFHANNAASTFLRLAEMGIERYLLASTINLVVSQRLLRRICEKCRFSQPVDAEYLKKFSHEQSEIIKNSQLIYMGKGCQACKGTGYKGRIAAFEIIKVTPEIQKLIIESATSKEIWDMAKKQGSVSMFEDAVEKSKLGITTFDEVFRVTPPI